MSVGVILLRGNENSQTAIHAVQTLRFVGATRSRLMRLLPVWSTKCTLRNRRFIADKHLKACCPTEEFIFSGYRRACMSKIRVPNLKNNIIVRFLFFLYLFVKISAFTFCLSHLIYFLLTSYIFLLYLLIA